MKEQTLGKKLMKKGTNYLMLGVVLSSSALLLLNTPTANAAEVNPDVAQILSESVEEASAVIYEDAEGSHMIPVSENSVVKLSATNTVLKMTIDGQKYELKDIKNVTFKGITVDRLVPFYLNTVEKVTLDNVNFTKGIDFSGMENIETLIVKDSTFGSSDYSLAVHAAPKLTTFAIDNSNFAADVRIYSNHELEVSHLSNSTFVKDVKQYSNKVGYSTDFINNRFERNKTNRVITSGGMNQNDVFMMNQNGANLDHAPFDETKDGFVAYTQDGEPQKIVVPAGVKVTKVKDLKDTVTIELSDGNVYKIEGSSELYFRNVDITTPVAFTSKHLRLNKMAFVETRTKLIDIAYSETVKDVQVIDTEISQSSGYLSIYNNKAIENLEIQNSKVTGSSGYISVYNNKQMSKFVMNDMYTHGYLSAYNLGDTVLQISNSLFDDYISTNQVIEGEGERAVIGYLPEIHGAKDITLKKGSKLNVLENVTATDFEDGDLTGKLEVTGNVKPGRGIYPVDISVTDMDGNTVSVTINVTIK
ncbi:MAG: immunoglobulin-like domain-containing protein [Vagococcus sp.]